MPDISKLPELARILDVSIDELLGEKSELIEKIANTVVCLRFYAVMNGNRGILTGIKPRKFYNIWMNCFYVRGKILEEDFRPA